MKPGPALNETNLDLELYGKGKVRDTYVIDNDHLLMVTTDRISAYDHVLPNGVPDRGKVLTQLSIWWFLQTDNFQPNHLVSGMMPDLPESLRSNHDLIGRIMIVRKARRIDVECVVRGYLAGSGWEEYKQQGTLAGEKLPAGMVESQKLPAPMFTPATKEDSGHDRNITYKELEDQVGADLALRLKEASLALYAFAVETVEPKGLILCDTKFEFGQIGQDLILIDEALTPDSSRYWDLEGYRPGSAPPSFDKQFVRDWLSQSGWDRESSPPELPVSILDQTRDRYLYAYQAVTGQPLFPKPERV
ncbi:MAG TPA: phosphoribosylaminoimidazolesuccinocarboxamide synthase [Candidatus Dormibacteraeota bacterium]|jgi:phosphoribosylaminoimidazole-succinocarboxamide synthase|nr:phosphoribosylaminoimidazolesuccinocarboxamide synthase [Candidatus Dormibacteraeota bacterium]